jgi:hypothetical protein
MACLGFEYDAYHQLFKHGVVVFVSSVLEGQVELLKCLLPVAFSTELLSLL